MIELLVVVSIVALLLAILLPALKKAREQAKVVICTTNLKAIATASLTYAAEDRNETGTPLHPLFYGESYPWVTGVYSYGGKSGRGEPVDGSSPLNSTWGTQEGRGPGTRALNAVLFKGGFPDHRDAPGPNLENWRNDTELDVPVFRCPSDRGYTGYHMRAWKQSGLSSYDHYGTSYACSTFLAHVFMSVSPFAQKLSRIPNPSNTVYYLEGAGRFGWHTTWGTPADTDGVGSFLSYHWNRDLTNISTEIAGWHGRPFEFVTAFVDGRVGAIRMTGHQAPAPRLGHYPGATWGNIDTSTGIPTSPMVVGRYDDWHVMIIRGEGWQIDTLPGAPAMWFVNPLDVPNVALNEDVLE